MIASFWWGSTPDRRKTHWRRWDTLTTSKSTGGLGFRELQTFNKALLTKMAARVIKEPSALWVRILKGVYYPNDEFMEAKKGGRASWAWSSLMVGRDILKREGIWMVGSGDRIRVFSDPWLMTKPGFRVEGQYQGEPRREPRVSSMIGSNGRWETTLVRQLVSDEDATLILRMPLPHTSSVDTFLWPHTKTGEPVARSIYHRLRETTVQDRGRNLRNEDNSGLWRSIWNANVIPKVKTFAWRLVSNALAVKMNLIKRGMNVDPGCVICGMDETT